VVITITIDFRKKLLCAEHTNGNICHLHLWLKGEVALGSVLSIRALRDRTGHLEEFSEEYILFSAGFSP
jgi:hypothetical protein